MAADTEKAAKFIIDNWEALGVQELAGVLYMPATIQRRTKEGGLEEVPVMLRNVTNEHRFASRRKAREMALAMKLDLDRDGDLITQLENYAILAFAIRDAKKPYDQHVIDAETLYRTYDTQSLLVVWGKYNVWVEMLDPRFGEMSLEQLWQTIVRIAREKNPSPLADMPGVAQFTCMVHMAREALLSPNRPSWLQPPETSSAASSPPSN
jgi:hypothetical protein